MSVIAIAGLKGGVGKTTTAVNIAWLSSINGGRTLLIDLDPQGAASWLMRIEARVRGGGKSLISGQRSLADAIKATDYTNLSLLPSDFSFRNFDRRLDAAKHPKRALSKLLAAEAGDFDCIVIDCPPGLGLLAENVLRASNRVLIPTLPTALSLNAAARLLEFVEQRLPATARPSCHPFFNLVDRRRAAHRTVVDAQDRPLPGMLNTVVTSSSVVEAMLERRAPLPVIAPRSTAARAFQSLWNELATLA